MKRRYAFPAGLGLLVLAFGVAYTAPDEDRMLGPFPERGAIGEQIVTQHHVVTVSDVALASEVEIGTWRGTTAGIWLVVDATIAARVERRSVDVELFVDGVQYASTGRTSTTTLDGRVVDAGFPQTGSALIELPADILERPGARSAVLRIAPGGNVRLDSVVELRLDLMTLEVGDRVERDRVRAGER